MFSYEDLIKFKKDNAIDGIYDGYSHDYDNLPIKENSKTSHAVEKNNPKSIVSRAVEQRQKVIPGKKAGSLRLINMYTCRFHTMQD